MTSTPPDDLSKRLETHVERLTLALDGTILARTGTVPLLLLDIGEAATAIRSLTEERDRLLVENEHMRRRGEQREEQLRSWQGKYERLLLSDNEQGAATAVRQTGDEP